MTRGCPGIFLRGNDACASFTNDARIWGDPNAYLIFVIFFTPTHFEAWKFYSQKCVNSRQKFARDKTGVNYTLCVKLHTVCKFIHCVQNYTLCVKSHIMCEITRFHRGSFRVKYGKNSSHFKIFTLTPLVALATNIRCALSISQYRKKQIYTT